MEQSFVRKHRRDVFRIAGFLLLMGTMVLIWWSFSRPVTGIYLVDGGRGYIRLKRSGYSVEVVETYGRFGSADLKAFNIGNRLQIIKSTYFNSTGYGETYNLSASPAKTGDWDLQLVINSGDQHPNKPMEFLIAAWLFINPPAQPANPAIGQYLHRVPDERIAEYFNIIREGPPYDTLGNSSAITFAPYIHAPRLHQIAEGLVNRYPVDLQVRILLLEAILRNQDADGLQGRLDMWRTEYLESSQTQPLAYRSFVEAERKLVGLRATASGRNAYPVLLAGLALDSASETRMKMLQNLLNLDVLIPTQSLIERHFKKFLAMQTVAKVARAQLVLKLLAGERTAATDLAIGTYRFGQLLETYDDELITKLIGVAVRAIGAGGLELLVLDGVETVDESDSLALKLDLLNDYHTTSSLLLLLDDGLDSILPYYPRYGGANAEEAQTRHSVANAKFQTVRMANAARRRLLETREFPEADDSAAVAKNMRGGIPMDPFSPTSSSLLMQRDVSSDTLSIYSIGPDKKDHRAGLIYDPTNGTVSAGDIFTVIPRQRKYPFPKDGLRASSTAAVAALFPSGLPVDGFADIKGFPMSVAESSGTVYVFSFGPDVDQHRRGTSSSSPPYDQVQYDPTNGTTSRGDIFMTLPPE